MSAYMDTPHYRVNRYVAAIRIMGVPPRPMMGLECSLEDLEQVVRDSAHLYTEPPAPIRDLVDNLIEAARHLEWGNNDRSCMTSKECAKAQDELAAARQALMQAFEART